MPTKPPMSPDQLRWVLDHNAQIRGGHRVQIADAVDAWRADKDSLTALVSSLTRLLEGGYMQHKPSCRQQPHAWTKRAGIGVYDCERCGEWTAVKPFGRTDVCIPAPACTCDLDTLLATLTRLARSPEEQ